MRLAMPVKGATVTDVWFETGPAKEVQDLLACTNCAVVNRGGQRVVVAVPKETPLIGTAPLVIQRLLTRCKGEGIIALVYHVPAQPGSYFARMYIFCAGRPYTFPKPFTIDPAIIVMPAHAMARALSQEARRVLRQSYAAGEVPVYAHDVVSAAVRDVPAPPRRGQVTGRTTKRLVPGKGTPVAALKAPQEKPRTGKAARLLQFFRR